MWNWMKRIVRRVLGIFNPAIRYLKAGLRVARIILRLIDLIPEKIVKTPSWVIKMIDRIETSIKNATEVTQATLDFMKDQMMPLIDEVIRAVPKDLPVYAQLCDLRNRLVDYINDAKKIIEGL